MVYKEYSNDDYHKWLSKPFADNYGISENTIADWFVQQAGAVPVMTSYGVNHDNLLSDVIPKLKAGLNGGYANFLMITVNEGGGHGNWINHFWDDTANPLQDDIDYVNSLLQAIKPPAKGAPEVNGGAPYTDDEGQNTQAFYDSVPKGSVGAYYMPATMAGNAWVFATNWCVANAVYFGNPYDHSIDTIKSLGGDPFGSEPAKPAPGKGSPPKGKDTPGAKLLPNLQDVIDKTLKAIEDAMKFDVYGMNDKYTYTNNFVKVEKTFNNTYHITLRGDWLKKFGASNNTTDMNIDTGSKPKPDKPNKSPSSGAKTDTAQRILKWCKDNLGQAYDMDGSFGAQCVDMIAAVNHYLNLGLSTANYNGSLHAKDIWNNDLPNGWHRVLGNPADDNASAGVWNGLPDGSIVWFTNEASGHVAVKSGAWANCIQQNYGVPVPQAYIYGGPIMEADVGGWIASGGMGFLGAWVPD